MKRIISLSIILILTYVAQAQISGTGIPQIINHSPENYKLAAQNWAIVQDARGIMFIGNGGGVLQYDGTTWKVIKVANKTMVKSLLIDSKKRIYVGAKGEMGFLKQNESNTYEYVSLIDSLPDEHKDIKDVWQIFEINGGIFFFTAKKLLFYKNNKFKAITTKGTFKKAYCVNNRVFVSEKNVGLYEFVNGELVFIESSKPFAKLNIREILPRRNRMLIVAWPHGFFDFDGKEIKKLITPLDAFVQDNAVYTVIPYQNDYYAFGLFSNGLLITDRDFNFVQYLNQSKGLISNQVFALYEDIQKNLWMGTGNGISYVLFNSPFSFFTAPYGLDSKVTSSIIYKDKLYIGTPTGLVYKDWNCVEKDIEPFVKIENPKNQSQLWMLDTLQGKLLCASGYGLFTAEEQKLNYIIENKAINSIQRIKGQNKLFLAGGKTGFFVVEYKNNKWQLKNKIEGFDEKAKYVGEDQYGNIWVSDLSRGVYKIKLNKEYTKVIAKEFFDAKNGLPTNENNYVIELNNQVFFATEQGLYAYNSEKNIFEPNFDIDPYLAQNQLISVFGDSQQNIWYKEGIYNSKTDRINWELGVLLEYSDTIKFNEKAPFFQFRNNIYSINEIFEDNYVFGLGKGFVLYNHKLLKDYRLSFNAVVRKVEIIPQDSVVYGGEISQDSLSQKSDLLHVKADNILEHKYNNLRFSFSSTFYGYPKTNFYQFNLDDGSNTAKWSEKSSNRQKEYTNLHEGTYTFSVRAQNIYGIQSQIASYTFTIKPPWYRTMWAYGLYFLLTILAIWGIVHFSMVRLRKQNEMLERIVEERTAELKLQKQKIEEINQDITDSITYAKRIQEAMLPLKKIIDKALPSNFILFKPRDIVSGDFYWFAERDGKIMIAAVDCTGHGVPGAFMSMIGAEILSTIVHRGVTDAAELLNLKNKYVRQALKQEQTENQDGMDMALCVIDKKERTLEFAGAKNPLVYIEDDKLVQIKGDKQSIGGYQYGEKKSFTKTAIELKSDTTFYIFSDGYQDQFGGPKGRKFMIKRMKQIFTDIHKLPMAEQHKILDQNIEDWKKDTHQTDDIIVIGFRVEI